MSTFKIGDRVTLVQPLGVPRTSDQGTPAHEAQFRIERIDEESGVAYIAGIDNTTPGPQEVSLESLQLVEDD